MENAIRRLGLISAPIAALAACISTDSPVLDAAEGCDELRVAGQIENAQVDESVRRFMLASRDFGETAVGLKGDVLNACANIALDLGAQDTWSQLGGVDAAVSNGGGTGACDVAAGLVEQVIVAGQQANANVALSVSRGQCHYDFEAQAACDAECTANAACDPGTVETRCEPGALSVICSAACAAGSTCEGHADRPCNCMGQCEAECQGECRGTCIGPDGRRTENDPDCRGRCSSSCNGMCRGMCRIDQPAGVDCGADIRCTGSCEGSYSAPECTSTFTPPSCTVDVSCHAACSTRVAANAVCDPPTVKIFADITVAPEMEAVARTLEANLPPLLTAAEERGEDLLQAVRELATAGDDLAGRVDTLDGHSLACVGASSLVLAESLGHFDVTLSASVRVTTAVRVNAE